MRAVREMAKKICRSCQQRTVGTGAFKGMRDTVAQARTVELCVPCLEEADWENTHSDYGHDPEGPEVDESGADEAGKKVRGCWICFPELNRAGFVPATERTGTSRVGMRMTVKRTNGGKEKAQTVAAKVADLAATSITTRKGVVTLKVASDLGNGFTLRWTVEGSFLYAESSKTVAGKTVKVRNASEALKVFGK